MCIRDSATFDRLHSLFQGVPQIFQPQIVYAGYASIHRECIHAVLACWQDSPAPEPEQWQKAYKP